MAIYLVRWAAESDVQKARLDAALLRPYNIFDLGCLVMKMSFAQVRYVYVDEPRHSNRGAGTVMDGLIPGQQIIAPSFMVRSQVYVNHRKGLNDAEWDSDTQLERKILDLIRCYSMTNEFKSQKTLATSRKVDLIKRVRRREVAARA